MSRVYQILTGLKTHLVANAAGLTNDTVRVAWGDDRIVYSDDVATDPPKLTISLYNPGLSYAPDLRFSGYSREATIDVPNEIAELKRIKIPFWLHVQLDTFCRTLKDDWDLQEALQVLLAARIPVSVNHGTPLAPELVNYSVHPQLGDNQDDLTEIGFHKVHRFRTEVWLDDPRDIEEVALVLSVEVKYEDETITIEETP